MISYSISQWPFSLITYHFLTDILSCSSQSALKLTTFKCLNCSFTLFCLFFQWVTGNQQCHHPTGRVRKIFTCYSRHRFTVVLHIIDCIRILCHLTFQMDRSKQCRARWTVTSSFIHQNFLVLYNCSQLIFSSLVRRIFTHWRELSSWLTYQTNTQSAYEGPWKLCH